MRLISAAWSGYDRARRPMTGPRAAHPLSETCGRGIIERVRRGSGVKRSALSSTRDDGHRIEVCTKERIREAGSESRFGQGSRDATGRIKQDGKAMPSAWQSTDTARGAGQALDRRPTVGSAFLPDSAPATGDPESVARHGSGCAARSLLRARPVRGGRRLPDPRGLSARPRRFTTPPSPPRPRGSGDDDRCRGARRRGGSPQSPDDALAHYLLAKWNYRNGRPERRCEHAARAAALAPDDVDYSVLHATLLFDAGRPPRGARRHRTARSPPARPTGGWPTSTPASLPSLKQEDAALRRGRARMRAPDLLTRSRRQAAPPLRRLDAARPHGPLRRRLRARPARQRDIARRRVRQRDCATQADVGYRARSVTSPASASTPSPAPPTKAAAPCSSSACRAPAPPSSSRSSAATRRPPRRRAAGRCGCSPATPPTPTGPPANPTPNISTTCPSAAPTASPPNTSPCIDALDGGVADLRHRQAAAQLPHPRHGRAAVPAQPRHPLRPQRRSTPACRAT